LLLLSLRVILRILTESLLLPWQLQQFFYLFVRLVAFVLCDQLVLRIQLKHKQVFAIISFFLLIVIHTLFSGDNTSFDTCYQHKSHWYMYYNCQPFDFRHPYHLSLFMTIQLPHAVANAFFRENYPINLSLFYCYSVTVLHHSFYLAIPLSACLCLFTCIRSSHSCYRLPLILLPCSCYLSPLSGILIHTHPHSNLFPYHFYLRLSHSQS